MAARWPNTRTMAGFSHSAHLDALAAKREQTARPKTPMVFNGGETLPDKVRQAPPGIWASTPSMPAKPKLPAWGGESVSVQRELASWFNRYDTDGDGGLSLDEMRDMLQGMFQAGKAKSTLTPVSMAHLMAALDKDESGCLSRAEFEDAWHNWLGRALHPVRCLLVIDVQNDFISGTMAVSGGEAVVPVINKLRAEGGFDVIANSLDWHPSEHCSFHETFAKLPNQSRPAPLHPSLSAEEVRASATAAPFSNVVLTGPTGERMEQILWPRHCVQGSWGAALHKSLHSRPSDVTVNKGIDARVDSYSAFFDNMKLNDTGLLAKLRGLGVTHVYCTGIAFDYCVAASALHAAEEGLVVTVIEDACAAVAPDSAVSRKQAMMDAGITVCSVAELPEVMGRDTLGDVVHAAQSVSKARRQSRLLQHTGARHMAA